LKVVQVVWVCIAEVDRTDLVSSSHDIRQVFDECRLGLEEAAGDLLLHPVEVLLADTLREWRKMVGRRFVSR